MKLELVLATSLLLGTVSTSAFATVQQLPALSLSPSNNDSFISLNTYSGYQTETFSAAGALSENNGNSQVQGTISLSPSPSLSLSGSTVYGQSIGVLNISYSLEVIGPSSLSAIPVFVDASGSVGGSTTGHGLYESLESQFNVTGSNVSIHELVSGQPGTFNLDQSYGFQPNSIYTVTMIAEGTADVGILGGTASFFANADPTFTIDPTFANAAQYSVVLSPDVGNIPAAPEPSTWAMMILGLVGLGFVAYRRKSQMALSPALECPSV